MSLFLSLILLLTASGSSSATHHLTGKITDARSGEPLIAATIRLLGTTTGTITNEDGNYLLDLAPGDHALIVSYVGYKTDTVSFHLGKPGVLNHSLQPMDILLPEVTVNASEDPAVAIIRAAIRNKKENIRGLNSFSFGAYSKVWMKSGGKMAFVQETFLDGVQETGKPLKEFVRSVRKTENIKTSRMQAPTLDQFIDLTGEKLNFGDDVAIILPLAGDAFEYYDYKLVNTRTDGARSFYLISVIPKSRVLALTRGTLTIEGDRFALAGADLSASEGVKIPYLEEFSMNYKQTFTEYNGFWIPQVTNSSAGFEVNFGGLISLDKIEVSQTYVMHSVKVNGEIPGSVRAARKSAFGGYTADTTTKATYPDWVKKRRTKNKPDEKWARVTPPEKPAEFAATLDDTLRPVPLSELEIAAFKDLDSTKILEDLIKPKGVLSGMAEVNFGSEQKKEKEFGEKVSDFIGSYTSFRNNRVEGPYAGLKIEFDSLSSPWFYRGEAGYAFSLKQPEGNLTGGWYLGSDFLDRVELTLYRQVKPYPSQSVHNPVEVSILHTVLGSDPWNYTLNTGFTGGFSYYFTDSLSVRVDLTGEQIRNERAHTPVSLFNRNSNLRINPFVKEGWDSKAGVQFLWGDDPTGLSVVRQNGFLVKTTWSNRMLGSDFSYSTVMLAGQVRLKTLYSENFLAPYLLFRTEVYGAFGKPDLRQMFTPSTALDLVSVPGVFNGLKPWELGGDRVATLWAEHNWRSVPFQWMYLDWLAEKAIEVNTGAAWAASRQISGSSGLFSVKKPYWEVYGGLSRIFGFLKLDVTYTSRKDWITTVGLSSLF